MNNILKLRGTFMQKSHTFNFGQPKLQGGKIVKIDKIEQLIKDIKNIDLYWKNQKKYVNGIFFSAYYKEIVPKSRRINAFFKCGSQNMSNKIVGAKFSKDKRHHIITYYVEKDVIGKTLKEVTTVKNILNENFKNGISNTDFEKIENIVDFKKYEIKKTKFLQMIVDASNVEKFFVEENEVEATIDGKSIVSIYDTEEDVETLMEKLDINVDKTNILSNNTVYLDNENLSILQKEAPYLISMAVTDMSEMPVEEKKENENVDFNRFIKEPKDEPTIGVIDKPFKEGVYFSKWVESKNVGIPEFAINEEDYYHGTGVTSIIVDGQNLNPNYDDGCGNFKVRHFGVAVSNKFSSFRII